MNEMQRKKANERKRKRSTEDPGYRARQAELSRAWYHRNRERIRLRRQSDPSYLERRRAAVLETKWRKLGFGSITQWYERMLKLQSAQRS